MINQVIKLISPKKLEVFFEEESINEDVVIVRPTYMSICAADQRYYQGWRKKEILDKKLPLALIHEAVGEVVYDSKNIFEKGEKVVMIPNTPTEDDEIIKENYRKTSLFRSSSANGFMQNVVFMKRDRIIPLENIKESVGTLLELASVSINAIENFKNISHRKQEVLGVWGSGSMGYITALFLKLYFPESKIVVVGGTSREKMNYFSFADKTLLAGELDEDLEIDHAFECVGGKKSQEAINQIIDYINPQGTMSLLGVSEEPALINTRMVLEKGLNILGNSRSGYQDFKKAVELSQGEQIQEYLNNIIEEQIEIKKIDDIYKAFEHDLNNDFKTVMKWSF